MPALQAQAQPNRLPIGRTQGSVAATLRCAAVGAFLLLAPALPAADQREEALAIIRAAETYIASFNQYEYSVTVNIDSAHPDPRFVGKMTMEGEVRRRGRETSMAFDMTRVPPEGDLGSTKIVEIFLADERIYSPQGRSIFVDRRNEPVVPGAAPFAVGSPHAQFDVLYWMLNPIVLPDGSILLLSEVIKENEEKAAAETPPGTLLYSVREDAGSMLVNVNDSRGAALAVCRFAKDYPHLPESITTYGGGGQVSRKWSAEWTKQSGHLFPISISIERYGVFGKTLEDGITPKLEFVDRLDAALSPLSVNEPIDPHYFSLDFVKRFKPEVGPISHGAPSRSTATAPIDPRGGILTEPRTKVLVGLCALLIGVLFLVKRRR